MRGVCLDESLLSSLSARVVKCSPIRAQNSCRNVLSWMEMNIHVHMSSYNKASHNLRWIFTYKVHTDLDTGGHLIFNLRIHKDTGSVVAMATTLPVSLWIRRLNIRWPPVSRSV